MFQGRRVDADVLAIFVCRFVRVFLCAVSGMRHAASLYREHLDHFRGGGRSRDGLRNPLLASLLFDPSGASSLFVDSPPSGSSSSQPVGSPMCNSETSSLLVSGRYVKEEAGSQSSRPRHYSPHLSSSSAVCPPKIETVRPYFGPSSVSSPSSPFSLLLQSSTTPALGSSSSSSFPAMTEVSSASSSGRSKSKNRISLPGSDARSTGGGLTPRGGGRDKQAGERGSSAPPPSPPWRPPKVQELFPGKKEFHLQDLRHLRRDRHGQGVPPSLEETTALADRSRRNRGVAGQFSSSSLSSSSPERQEARGGVSASSTSASFHTKKKSELDGESPSRPKGQLLLRGEGGRRRGDAEEGEGARRRNREVGGGPSIHGDEIFRSNGFTVFIKRQAQKEWEESHKDQLALGQGGGGEGGGQVFSLIEGTLFIHASSTFTFCDTGGWIRIPCFSYAYSVGEDSVPFGRHQCICLSAQQQGQTNKLPSGFAVPYVHVSMYTYLSTCVYMYMNTILRELYAYTRVCINTSVCVVGAGGRSCESAEAVGSD